MIVKVSSRVYVNLSLENSFSWDWAESSPVLVSYELSTGEARETHPIDGQDLREEEMSAFVREFDRAVAHGEHMFDAYDILKRFGSTKEVQ